jgi:hypothetical protein
LLFGAVRLVDSERWVFRQERWEKGEGRVVVVVVQVVVQVVSVIVVVDSLINYICTLHSPTYSARTPSCPRGLLTVRAES